MVHPDGAPNQMNDSPVPGGVRGLRGNPLVGCSTSTSISIRRLFSTGQVHRTIPLTLALLPRFLPHRGHAFKEVHHARRNQTIENLRPSLLVVHNPRISQLGKVPGDGGHLGSHQGGQFAHASLPPRQLIQHQQAPRMRQRFEYLRLTLESGHCGLVGHGADTFSHVANRVNSFIRLLPCSTARSQRFAPPSAESSI